MGLVVKHIHAFVVLHRKIFLSFGWEVCYNEHTPFNCFDRRLLGSGSMVFAVL